MKRSFLPRALAAVLAASCSGGDEKPTEIDARVELPRADPAFIDFHAPEVVIAPGSEKMTCTHFTYTGEDTAFFDQAGLQGKFGHHAILLTAKNPLPDGTTEDCTDAGDMARFEPFSIPERIPEKHGVFLKKGHHLVLQSHYVNTGRIPVRTRDVVRLSKRALADVETWVAMYVTNSFRFEVPAKSTFKESFDCTLEQDLDLLLVGGHMHEWGTRFEVLAGPDADHLTTVYRTEPWVPEFRDSPPVKLYFTEPLHLPKGSVVRTVCDWNNDQDHALSFPHEMCSSFGYAAGVKEPVKCVVGQE